MKLLSNPLLSSNKHNFLVKWPIADFDSMGNALSTYKCDRLQRETPISDDQIIHSEGREKNSSSFSIYVPEELHVTISLMRASEVITVGTADIVITGQEENNTYLKVPIHTTKNMVNDNRSPTGFKRSPMRLFKKGDKGKSKRPITFLSDSKRTYSLEKTAYLRVVIKVNPAHNSQPKRQKIPKQWNRSRQTKMSTGVSLIDTEFDNSQPCPVDLIRQTQMGRNPMLVEAYKETNRLWNCKNDLSQNPTSQLPWFNNNPTVANVRELKFNKDHNRRWSSSRRQIKSSTQNTNKSLFNATDDNIMRIGLRPTNNFNSSIDNIPRHLSIMETASSDYDISLMSMSQLSRTHEEIPKTGKNRGFFHEDESTMMDVGPCDQLGFLSTTKNFFQCQPLSF